MSKWQSFKAKKWLGLPAPIVAGCLAVLMVASVAVAAVLFFARADVSVTVRPSPDLYWSAPTIENTDGVVVTASRTNDGPATCTGGSGCTATVQMGRKLTISITDAYATGSFDLSMFVYAPCTGGTNLPQTVTCDAMQPLLKVTGLDLNHAGVITATLIEPGVVIGGNLGPATGSGSVHQSNDGRKWKGFPVRVHVSIDATATPGSYSATDLDGLIVTTA